mmetsp:Transcript_18702/g.42818  ORF Transcript_18702/g.42818 Transcript_18702/m.42818 type:complete len:248 (-) Transcript_18702:1404-2147(-)
MTPSSSTSPFPSGSCPAARGSSGTGMLQLAKSTSSFIPPFSGTISSRRWRRRREEERAARRRGLRGGRKGVCSESSTCPVPTSLPSRQSCKSWQAVNSRGRQLASRSSLPRCSRAWSRKAALRSPQGLRCPRRRRRQKTIAFSQLGSRTSSHPRSSRACSQKPSERTISSTSLSARRIVISMSTLQSSKTLSDKPSSSPGTSPARPSPSWAEVARARASSAGDSSSSIPSPKPLAPSSPSSATFLCM